VKTQVWIAVAVYVMVAILHKELQLRGTLHRTLQILSVHPFEKVPLHELFRQADPQSYAPLHSKQSMLWGL
jgi:hypothetical protein